MKLIPLTRGLFARVDDDDYERLIGYKWNAHFNQRTGTSYAQYGKYLGGGRANAKRKIFHMHRVVMNVAEGFHVDHADGDTLNNQKSNLRICTHSQNMANRRSFKNSSSKYKGVEKRKGFERWRARIRVNKKPIYLGQFKTEVEAALAYNEAAIKHHGYFARLNIIQQ